VIQWVQFTRTVLSNRSGAEQTALLALSQLQTPSKEHQT
jgi:hypothetical protein